MHAKVNIKPGLWLAFVVAQVCLLITLCIVSGKTRR